MTVWATRADQVDLRGPNPHDLARSPHFPYAAQIWTAMWRARTGEQLDGVIAIDPFTLGYLLDATGPVRLDDGTTLTGANAADFILKDEYAVLAGAQRKQYLVTLGRAVFDHLVTGAGSTRALITALGRAAGEGRLLIATPAHPAEQALLETRRLGGTLPETTAPFAAVVINDAGSGKLDYYLGRRLSYNAESCANGQRTATVDIALTNNAPATGLPDYVVTRADKPSQPYPRGQTRTLTLTLIEPAAAGTMTTLEQPIVEPQQSAVRLTPCTTG